jgi:DNA-directed RNA polymerase sigma subunit (sigma70/sigma32)
MKCITKVRQSKTPCQKEDCRKWIKYPKDLNCILEAIEKNNGAPLTLRETAERLGISFVRVKQIESRAITRLQKKKLEQLND